MQLVLLCVFVFRRCCNSAPPSRSGRIAIIMTTAFVAKVGVTSKTCSSTSKVSELARNYLRTFFDTCGPMAEHTQTSKYVNSLQLTHSRRLCLTTFTHILA